MRRSASRVPPSPMLASGTIVAFGPLPVALSSFSSDSLTVPLRTPTRRPRRSAGVRMSPLAVSWISPATFTVR